MGLPEQILDSLPVDQRYRDGLADTLGPLRLFTYVDILVVVDTDISTQPGVPFGVGSVIELIRSTRIGCLRFRADIALRSGGAPTVVPAPSEYGAKFTGFRFDMTDDGTDVLDRYEQVWCFGFEPGNDGGDDANIDQPGAFPATDAELAKLAAWMKDRKGGVFATGDHDYLGASMCRRIPRIGTMRLWTNADGVPPIGTPDRIDTLRPPSPAYEPGAPGGPLALGNSPHQGDTTPQPIDWVSWIRYRLNFFQETVRPHPVLCHPSLGPIDIMPDHAHEGLCRDTGTVPLGGTFNFDGAGAQPEYPDATGPWARPEPQVIAYGSTLGSPPYSFSKGPQPERPKFPMISVYDGHRAGVGRVATDSTWHHWMDINISNMKSAAGADWEKVARYFVNLALWLRPPGYSSNCLFLETMVSHVLYPGFQEYSQRLRDIELGAALKGHLVPTYGPCWVTQTLIDIFDFLKVPLFEKPGFPIPDPCLTCPPFELLENAALGGLVRASFEQAEELKRAVSFGTEAPPVKAESLAELMLPGVGPALEGLAAMWREDLAGTERFLKTLSSKASK